MRRTGVTLLALLALAGCAAHRPQAESAAASPVAAKRAIVRVDVTNTFGRPIDVYYGSTFLGSLAPYGNGSYTVPPTTARVPVYGRLSGAPQRSFNLSQSRAVHYVYGDAGPSDG